MLILNQVTKVFDKNILALDKISFQMGKGELLFLVGPNKAGKTTLLKLIALEEKPTEGEVVLDGLNSQTIKKKEIPLLRRNIGRIFQDFFLIQDLNVFDNVALGLRILGRKESRVKNEANHVLETVGLCGKDEFFPYQLSSGEKQKVAIARAIARDPLLLLADEPTLNLDHESTDEILRLLKKINLLGTAVLIATQDFNLYKNHNTKIIKIEKGKLV